MTLIGTTIPDREQFETSEDALGHDTYGGVPQSSPVRATKSGTPDAQLPVIQIFGGKPGL